VGRGGERERFGKGGGNRYDVGKRIRAKGEVGGEGSIKGNGAGRED